MGTLPVKLVERVVACGGVLESGMLANMRTYLLPRETTIHTRLVGEGRTLCGRPLRGFEGRWAWQFVNRGTFAASMPSGSQGDSACQQCARSPVLVATAEAVEAKRRAWRKLAS
jgi:hypothetical protein